MVMYIIQTTTLASPFIHSWASVRKWASIGVARSLIKIHLSKTEMIIV